MRLIYHPDAEQELIEAAQFYEKRVPTLGTQFLDATDYAIGLIQKPLNDGRLLMAMSGTTSCLASHMPFIIELFQTTSAFSLSRITAAIPTTGDTA